MSVAVIACIEKGGLEYKGLCMLLTLRRNWGGVKDIPIYIYSPREGREVSPWLLHIFDHLEVNYITAPLNRAYLDYPLANKPLVMAHAENNLKHDNLIFLDSDILCFKEPELELPVGKDLAMTVDTTKTVASSGPHDPYDPIWMDLYRIAHSEHYPFVTTSLTNEKVRSWYGSGVVMARASAGLMTKWLSVFETALNEVDFFPQMFYLREQMTISAVAASAAPAFLELPVQYNYPIQNHYHFTPRGAPPPQAVLWHYQQYFNRSFKMFGNRLDRIGSVAAKISAASEFALRLENHFDKMLGLDETPIQRLRRRLKLGTRLRRLISW